MIWSKKMRYFSGCGEIEQWIAGFPGAAVICA